MTRAAGFGSVCCAVLYLLLWVLNPYICRDKTMANQKSDGPKLADVERENAELKAKIAALKSKLGITAAEEKEELARVKSIFAMFDRDNDGSIDKTEFELLAFECGTDVAALTPENIQKSFTAGKSCAPVRSGPVRSGPVCLPPLSPPSSLALMQVV